MAVESHPRAPFILIEDWVTTATLRFQRPHRIIRADRPDEVDSALVDLLAAHQAGHYLAGYAAYELGYTFEARLRKLAPATDGPLLCFGVFSEPDIFDWTSVNETGTFGDLVPLWSSAEYQNRFDRVIAYIAAGDVYQVNLTFPLEGRWTGDPVALYASLRRNQAAPFGAVIALDDPVILSFSPELFFETSSRTIRTRPMKGTAPRGRSEKEDDILAQTLFESPKDRAENLMIVDLLRNDLGRISELGSVTVTDLFTIERYSTVLQMTSGVEARLQHNVTIRDLFIALFPCGSITGAPKIRAMEIIRELEEVSRNAYCGSIGFIRPNGDARFNVAIRTATLQPSGNLIFNVGSGVVFDSSAQAEYEECLLKARFLNKVIRTSA